MGTRHVVVVPYDEAWKKDFEDIRAELSEVLDGIVMSIEHVGSTSVPGLYAKPIIDIDVVIKDYSVFPEIVKRLEQAGYHH